MTRNKLLWNIPDAKTFWRTQHTTTSSPALWLNDWRKMSRSFASLLLSLNYAHFVSLIIVWRQTLPKDFWYRLREDLLLVRPWNSCDLFAQNSHTDRDFVDFLHALWKKINFIRWVEGRDDDFDISDIPTDKCLGANGAEWAGHARHFWLFMVVDKIF